MIWARPGDVGFTQGCGWLQGAIRLATRGPREEKTWANHALMFTTRGGVGPGLAPDRQAYAVEALWHVEVNPWYERHRKDHGTKLRVYRPTFLSPAERERVVETALAHVGERYGWWKLAAHLADRVLFDDRKVVSSFLRVDSRPICSYLVARAYEVAGHPKAFGPIPAAAQDPDEMMDFVDNATYRSPRAWRFVGEVAIP